MSSLEQAKVCHFVCNSSILILPSRNVERTHGNSNGHFILCNAGSDRLVVTFQSDSATTGSGFTAMLTCPEARCPVPVAPTHGSYTLKRATLAAEGSGIASMPNATSSGSPNSPDASGLMNVAYRKPTAVSAGIRCHTSASCAPPCYSCPVSAGTFMTENSLTDGFLAESRTCANPRSVSDCWQVLHVLENRDYAFRCALRTACLPEAITSNMLKSNMVEQGYVWRRACDSRPAGSICTKWGHVVALLSLPFAQPRARTI